MFDGNVYTDAVPVRKGAYAPGAPSIGPAAGGILRNAFVYSRMRSRGGLAQAYPRNLRVPSVFNYWAPMVNSVFGSTLVVKDWRYVAAHWTHLQAQVCFSILDDADTATVELVATDGTNTNSFSQTIALSPGSEARVEQGDTLFEGRATSYEAILQLPLFYVPSSTYGGGQSALTLPGVLAFSIVVGSSATTKDASPVTTTKVLLMDSVSMWLECQEVVTP